MVGFQSGENLWQYVRNCACVVVPSEWYEASGYTACEAQAMGKPLLRQTPVVCRRILLTAKRVSSAR